jgi:hypothetical protein
VVWAVLEQGGASLSHAPFFSREAALSYSKVGMPGPWRPKFQLRSGVSAGCDGGLAAQMGHRRPPARSLRLGERADPTLDLRARCRAGRASPSRNTLFNHELHNFSRMGSGFARNSPCWFYSCSFGLFVVQGHPGSRGAARRSTIEEVPACGVMGTRRRGGEPFSLGSSRRLTLQGFARGSALRYSGRGIVLA